MKVLREKSYVIPGPCIALARPRISQNRCYDSQKHIKLCAGLQLRNQHKQEPLFESKPLLLDATFYIEIPKTRLKYVHEGDYMYFKSDLDNLIKFVCDCGNKLIWVDDALISCIIARKIYSQTPRTEFTVKELR